MAQFGGHGHSSVPVNRPGPKLVEQSNPYRRLNSWKEIAEYIGRDVRTAHHWEQSGLPVHRVVLDKGSNVYALTAELDEWLAKRTASPIPSPEPESEQPPRRRVAMLGLLAGAAALVAAVAIATWLIRTPEQVPTPPLEPAPLTAYDGIEMHPSFSPDGGRIVFAWNGGGQNNYDIYAKVVGTGSPVRLTNDPAPDFDPVWSPDGTRVAFHRQGQGIFLMPPIGGTERKLFEDVDEPRTGYPPISVSARRLAWSADGEYVAFARAASHGGHAGIFLISSRSGQAKRVTENDAYGDWAPAFSPDGSSLAFVRCASVSSCSLFELDVDAASASLAPVRQLTEPSGYAGSIAWTPDGQTLVFSQAEMDALTPRLWRMPAHNTAEPELMSFALPVSDSVVVSRTGSRMAYSYFYADADLWKIHDGASSRIRLSSTRRENSPQFSPDGRRVVFSSARSGQQEIWVGDIDGSNAVQLTNSRGAGSPRWSPDGKGIVYDTQTDDGLGDIYVMDASGGETVPLVRHAADDKAPSFSCDGKWVYFASNREGRDEIYRVPAAGGEPVRLTDNGGFIAFESADSGSIYYTKLSVGCSPLFTKPLSGGTERQVVESVCWRAFAPTAQGIYYITNTPDNQDYAVMLLDPANGKSRVIADKLGRVDQGLAVSRDGRTILFSGSNQDGADLLLVDNFR